MSKVRIAFIGCGKRAHAAARGVSADERSEVVALVDLNPEAAQAMADEFRFEAPIFTDHHEMLTEVKPDFVIGSLWTPLHLPVFRDCAEAGVKGFLSEKPMAPSWGEALEMAAISEQTGCQLTFCHQRRFAKGNQLVRRLLEEGVFGEIKGMDLYSPCGLLDCGTHSIDQAMSFNRETPAKWVFGGVDTSEVKEFFAIPTETMAFGLIIFENGVRANIQCQGPDRHPPTGVRIHATNGTLEVAWDGQVSQAVKFDEPSWTMPEPEPQETQAQMHDVITNCLDSLISGKEPEISYKKALRATEVIYALYESATTRRRIELPLVNKNNVFVETFGPEAVG